jgi:hypothetical protein
VAIGFLYDKNKKYSRFEQHPKLLHGQGKFLTNLSHGFMCLYSDTMNFGEGDIIGTGYMLK